MINTVTITTGIAFFMILLMGAALFIGQLRGKKDQDETCIIADTGHEEPHTCGLCNHFGTGGCSLHDR